MSHARTDEQEPESPEYRGAQASLARMIATGRSFSARERNVAFWNTGDRRFAEAGAVSGLDAEADGRALAVSDFDRDGDLDLWTTNRTAPALSLFENGLETAGRSLSLLVRGDARPIREPGAADQDFPDADLDSGLAALFVTHGTEPPDDFEADPPPSVTNTAARTSLGKAAVNRDAIGARVRLVGPDGRAMSARSVTAGDAFLSQSSPWLHFGLGTASGGPLTALVRWPGGAEERFSDLMPGGRYVLELGQPSRWVDTEDDESGHRGAISESADPERPTQALADPRPSDSSPIVAQREFDRARERRAEAVTDATVHLGMKLRLPPLPYRTRSGDIERLPIDRGRPLVLSLWASWCAPCLEELDEWRSRKNDFAAARASLLALSVDGLGEDDSNEKAAADAISRLQLTFPTGHATAETMALLQDLNDTLMTADRPLPVPTTLVIDADGRLARMYHGRVGVDVLLTDLDTIATEPSATDTFGVPTDGSQALPGHYLDHGALRDTRSRRALSVRMRAAAVVARHGFTETAVEHYRAARSAVPEHPGPPAALGVALAELGRLHEAAEALSAAQRLAPNDATIANNLGSVAANAGDLGKARTHFRHALRLRPAMKEARQNLERAERMLAPRP